MNADSSVHRQATDWEKISVSLWSLKVEPWSWRSERKARAYLGQILLKKEGLHGLSDGGCIVATEQSPQKWLKCNPVSCIFEELRCSPGLVQEAPCPSQDVATMATEVASWLLLHSPQSQV